MIAEVDEVSLRQLTLAVSVLDDVDLLPFDGGVVVDGDTPVEVPWGVLAAEVGGLPLDGRRAHRRGSRLLRTVRALAAADAADLASRVRPLGFPRVAPDHPGADWVVAGVPGGSLDVGLGVVGLLGEPDRVDVLLAAATALVGLDPLPCHEAAAAYLRRMGRLAASRVAGVLEPVLRPMGDCDVVTLLASPAFRRAVCAPAGGLRTAAVPMRSRGWLDLRRVDPLFAAAAAAATPERDRGFPRPLLLTVDEVTMVAPRGDFTGQL